MKTDAQTTDDPWIINAKDGGPANARLIACAPELRDALLALDSEHGFDRFKMTPEWCARVRAILAKL